MKDMTDDRPYSRREFVKVTALAGATLVIGGGLAGLLSACAGGKTAGTTGVGATSTATSAATATSTTAALQPIVVPTLPAQVPGYGQVDPATGLHVQGTPTVIDPVSYRLKVDGKVAHPQSLSYDDIRRLAKVTTTSDLICPGVFIDTATWSGASLQTILDMAGLAPDSQQIRLNGADGHYSYLDLKDALVPDNFLAYELRGQTMPVLQGFPLRAVLPGQTGSRWVKWLLEIVVE
jgi:DMSO/TMAO reductase YedYZ molybdopterin-dependent catalytic subunit